MALVFMVAPTSNTKRIELVSQHARGFIYCVSLTGVTGERAELPADVRDFIRRVRAHTDQRLVMGFGIGTPEQARMMNEFMDGFIVGSALVRAGKGGAEPVKSLATRLRAALN
jgi:tryptophan synthase alpha chain